MYSSQDPRFLPAMVLKTLTSAMAYIKAEIETTCCRQVSAQVPTSFCLSLLPRSPVNTRRVMPRVKMCSVSKGKRNATEKVLQRVRFVSCPHTIKTTCFMQRQCSRRSPHSRQNWDRPLPVGRAGQEAEEGEEALGCLLPLKSPLSSSCQHPPAQGHRV